MWNTVRFSRHLSLIVGMAAVTGLGLPVAAQSDDAATVSQIIEDLRSKATRSVTVNPADQAKEAEQARVLEELKAIARDRGLSAGQRSQLAEVTANKPQHTFNVPFSFNSAVVEPEAQSQLNSLGRALQNGEIKTTDFLLAGHTDAKGGADYNLKLSQRRADAVRDYLTKNFNMATDKLIAVGYGREKPINPRNPFADENRRVEVINVATTTASASK